MPCSTTFLHMFHKLYFYWVNGLSLYSVISYVRKSVLTLQHKYYLLWSLLCVRHNIAWFYITLYSFCFWRNTVLWAKFITHFPLYEFTPELVTTKYNALVFMLLLCIYEALGLSLSPESSCPDWGFVDP